MQKTTQGRVIAFLLTYRQLEALCEKHLEKLNPNLEAHLDDLLLEFFFSFSFSSLLLSLVSDHQDSAVQTFQ